MTLKPTNQPILFSAHFFYHFYQTFALFISSFSFVSFFSSLWYFNSFFFHLYLFHPFSVSNLFIIISSLNYFSFISFLSIFHLHFKCQNCSSSFLSNFFIFISSLKLFHLVSSYFFFFHVISFFIFCFFFSFFHPRHLFHQHFLFIVHLSVFLYHLLYQSLKALVTHIFSWFFLSNVLQE